MKNIKTILIAVFVVATLLATAQNSKKDFYGMWTIDIEGGSVGWLNVHEDSGFLDAELLWRGGSVVPVAHVYFVDDNNLVVTRTGERVKSDDRKHVVTQTFNFKRKGDKLEGVLVEPSRDGMGANKTKFKGWKLPDVGPAPDLSKVKYGEPIELFNGKDLTGWKLINPKQANGFKVLDGVLINDPVNETGERVRFGNLRTEKDFGDFNIKLDVNVPAHSNSGVYLRGMYEIQVVDSYGNELDSHNMGGLYSRVSPTQAAEKQGGEWQTMDITLCQRHVTVILNGKLIIDNQPAYGPTGGAMIADVFKPGPIYLQGDHGKVSYRNIVLTPIIK
ncbi:MAG: DUF1080 domain-containing protein [Prolixibacteraceae bacterium]|jgi:hypothetical protein|nr:DUF1080 domain-containing protein [Prolixibacteraceae bacterium]MBT6004551.1 DUF1080 domain-containing protein [Prolixibacteraceae bacterium]MBT7000723.1 DUF1080 domain-containing protein [Prolixibacteraceae bacterium]MBT7395311.1 DUF1080 domain-containing protein [Prolixibacteraceae bacterium]